MTDATPVTARSVVYARTNLAHNGATCPIEPSARAATGPTHMSTASTSAAATSAVTAASVVRGDVPLFTAHADATLSRVRATYAERGEQYGDTWKEACFVTLNAVLHRLGYDVAERDHRAVAAAVLCDVKYWRGLGGFKDDSLVDGIAYSALLAEEMRQREEVL